MDEQKEIIGEKKEKPTTEDTGKGDDDKTISELDRADSIVERQKRENDRREELISRDEKLQARKMIGGSSEAGQPSEKKEETPHDYRMRVQKELAEGKTDFGD